MAPVQSVVRSDAPAFTNANRRSLFRNHLDGYRRFPCGGRWWAERTTSRLPFRPDLVYGGTATVLNTPYTLFYEGGAL